MERGRIIIAILDDIVQSLDDRHLITPVWLEAYNDDKEISATHAIYRCSDGAITEEPYSGIVAYLRHWADTEGIDDNVDIVQVPYYTLSVSNSEARKRKYKALYTKSDPYVVTLDVFGSPNHITLDDTKWKLWERIWAAIIVNANERERFWQELLNNQRSVIYIQTDLNRIKSKLWNIYAYAYLSVVNENKFDIPSVLNAQNPYTICSPLSYKRMAKYDQFFDVYDVLNEVKHSTDILTQFMKVYQVLELLAYRRKFQELIKEHLEHQYPIVRKIESLTDSFKKNEKKELKELFVKCFPNIQDKLDPRDSHSRRYTAGSAYLTPNCCEYLKLKYEISYRKTGHPKIDTGNISDLVYGVRCSIVHNKETEFHFTFNNVEEYKDIVPLMDKLIEILQIEILELINKGSDLVYTHDKLPLY